MASAEGPPLSLRPFPVADKEPSNLSEFIARVNTQAGGFRAATEGALQDEIRSRDSPGGASDQDDIDMSDAGNDDDTSDNDPGAARMEVLKNIDIASNTAMLTLDSLSLLLSKQSPTQAGLTLSQQLRDMVGIGTLGADTIDEPIAHPNKAKDDEEIALGWTIMDINQTRDAASKAASFLEREVDGESRYWEDIMTVKKSGWSLCKVPQERHTIGVKFGFPEAAAEFKNNGLAPMRRGDNGSAQLDLGRLGGVSEGVMITYERDGKVVGRSIPRRETVNDTSLQSRVLDARNTIFAQELWHELTREARTLAAYDVRRQGSTLTYAVDDSSKLVLGLVPLDSCAAVDETLPQNKIADTISLSLHILLSYAHRYNELMRIRPIPPHVSRSRGQQVYALLRPVIARIISTRNAQDCCAKAGTIVQLLQKADIPASFTLKTPQYSMVDPTAQAQGSNQPAGSQSLVRNMLQPVDFTMDVSIYARTAMTIRARTLLFPVTTTFYQVLLPTPPPPGLYGANAPHPDGYTDVKGLFDYLKSAAARIVLSTIHAKLREKSTSESWIQSPDGCSIENRSKQGHSVSIKLHNEPGPSLQLSVTAGSEAISEPQRWTWSTQSASESRGLGSVVDETLSGEIV